MTRKPPLWLLVLVTISGTVGMHMFLPALPDAARDLGTSAGQMQMTISVYILGLGLGQLVYGPLSDAFGRRPVLMVGLLLYVIGSAAAALAPNVTVLLCARIIQALGGCAGVAIGRAIVRDTSSQAGTARSMGILAMMMSFNPILAPMVGGAVTATAGWRANFLVLGLLGAVTLGLVFKLLQETARPSGKFEIAGALRDYRELMSSRHYLCFAIGGGILTTCVFAFVASAPFIFTQQLNLSVQMAGVYAGIVVLGLAAGNGFGSLYSKKISGEILLRAGAMISLVCSIIFLLLVLTNQLSVPLLVTVILLLTCGLGMTNPVAIGRAMAVDPRLFGSAAGLYGAIQMAAGATITTLTALGTDPAIAAAMVMASAILFAMMCFEIGLRSKPFPA